MIGSKKAPPQRPNPMPFRARARHSIVLCLWNKWL